MGESTRQVQSSFQKLSSGLRINRAGDDAAGLSVSSLLNADRRVLDQGIRNLNDGISALNIAEGALGELGNIVIRQQELAEQSANGTLGNSQRAALQSEASALQSEWNRIMESTTFNGVQLLTGNSTSAVLQGGYGSPSSLTVQIGEAAIASLSQKSLGL